MFSQNFGGSSRLPARRVGKEDWQQQQCSSQLFFAPHTFIRRFLFPRSRLLLDMDKKNGVRRLLDNDTDTDPVMSTMAVESIDGYHLYPDVEVYERKNKEIDKKENSDEDKMKKMVEESEEEKEKVIDIAVRGFVSATEMLRIPKYGGIFGATGRVGKYLVPPYQQDCRARGMGSGMWNWLRMGTKRAVGGYYYNTAKGVATNNVFLAEQPAIFSDAAFAGTTCVLSCDQKIGVEDGIRKQAYGRYSTFDLERCSSEIKKTRKKKRKGRGKILDHSEDGYDGDTSSSGDGSEATQLFAPALAEGWQIPGRRHTRDNASIPLVKANRFNTQSCIEILSRNWQFIENAKEKSAVRTFDAIARKIATAAQGRRRHYYRTAPRLRFHLVQQQRLDNLKAIKAIIGKEIRKVITALVHRMLRKMLESEINMLVHAAGMGELLEKRPEKRPEKAMPTKSMVGLDSYANDCGLEKGKGGYDLDCCYEHWSASRVGESFYVRDHNKYEGDDSSEGWFSNLEALMRRHGDEFYGEKRPSSQPSDDGCSLLETESSGITKEALGSQANSNTKNCISTPFNSPFLVESNLSPNVIANNANGRSPVEDDKSFKLISLSGCETEKFSTNLDDDAYSSHSCRFPTLETHIPPEFLQGARLPHLQPISSSSLATDLVNVCEFVTEEQGE